MITVALVSVLAASALSPQSTAGVAGTVYLDRNANGTRDPNEPGIAGVVVSDQEHVVITNAAGKYTLQSLGNSRLVFVSVPDGYRARGAFYQAVTDTNRRADFALVAAPRGARTTFVHASDTHISDASLARTQRLRALVDSLHPDFVIITGDLVRDALRVGEKEATSYYEMFNREVARFSPPVWTVPGNHENFGIERDKSGITVDHPLYGRGMYHHYRGPDYYSFNAGGVHFVALNTVDIDDTRYYGHVDSLQLAWLERDLAAIPASMPVITFNHIPFFTSVETVNGYSDQPPAPSVITVRGKSAFRHAVSNAGEVIARIKGHPYPIALGGHMHVPEHVRFEGVATRFEQAAAIVAPSTGGALSLPSGLTVYRISRGSIDAGTFIPLGSTETAGRH